MMIRHFQPGRIFAGPASIAVTESLGQPGRRYFARATGRAFDFKAADQVTEITLYDEIGYWGVTAKQFRDQLAAVKTPTIALKLNSPGGDVFDGIAMYNDLLAHPARVEIEVTGLAASAASLIAMAADRLTLAENAFLMIHNAWTIALGDRREMAATAGVLEKIDGALADTYAARSGQARAEIVRLMDDETWFDADEAVELGLADEIGGKAEVKASFDLSIFAKAPPALRAAASAAVPTERDCEQSLRDAGVSRRDAKAILARGLQAVLQRDAGSDDAELIAGLSQLRDTIAKGIAR